jgi:hypothetical protein
MLYVLWLIIIFISICILNIKYITCYYYELVYMLSSWHFSLHQSVVIVVLAVVIKWFVDLHQFVVVVVETIIKRQLKKVDIDEEKEEKEEKEDTKK